MRAFLVPTPATTWVERAPRLHLFTARRREVVVEYVTNEFSRWVRIRNTDNGVVSWQRLSSFIQDFKPKHREGT